MTDLVSLRQKAFDLQDNEQHVEAIEILTTIIEISDEGLVTAEDYEDRAFSFDALDRHEEALNDRRVALEEFDPDDPFVILYNKANTHVHLKQFDDALEAYTECLSYQRRCPDAWCNRGIVYARLNDFASSVRDYSEAIGLRANFSAAHFNRGLLFFRNQFFVEAIQDFSTAIRMSPNDAECYFYRGLVYRAQQLGFRAEKDFEKALEIDPGYDTARRALRVSVV